MKINPSAYEKQMTLDKDCWVAIIMSNDGGLDKVDVKFYNPKLQVDDDLDFRGFAEIFMDENFIDAPDSIVKYQDEEVYAFGGRASNGQDVDEDNRRVINTIEVDCQFITIYKNKDITNEEKLKSILVKLEKDFELFRSDLIESFKDGEEYRKDPYAYYGVSRKDFF